MKKKILFIMIIATLTSCGSMRLATNSGYSLTPQVKTEKDLKEANHDWIVTGVIILITLIAGDFTKKI